MNEQEKQEALISLCKIEIRRWKAATEAKPDMKYMVELMQIALAALTAEPDIDVDPSAPAGEKTIITRFIAPPGWRLVPVEMTDDIGEAIAMEAGCCGGIALDIYDAALRAAPEPPSC